MAQCPDIAELKAQMLNKSGSQYDCFSVSESSKLTAKFKVGKGIVEGIIDSGCKHVLINEDVYKRVVIAPRVEEAEVSLRGANNSSLEVVGTDRLLFKYIKDNWIVPSMPFWEQREAISRATRIQSSKGLGYFKMDSDLYVMDILIVKDLAVDCIIGLDAWRALGINIVATENRLDICGNSVKIYKHKLDMSRGTTLEPGKVTLVKCNTTPGQCLYVEGICKRENLAVIPGIMRSDENGEGSVLIWNRGINPMSISPEEVVLLAETDFAEEQEDVATADFDLNKVKFGEASPKRISKIKKILRKWKNIFREKTRPGERYNGSEGKIMLKEGWTPQVDRLFAKRPEVHEKLQKETENLLERDLIEKSDSPWRANAMLLKKKDGTTRFAIDYRKLNSQCTIIAFPMPLISEIIGQLRGMKVMSKVDFCDGFWAIPLADESRPYTAFATREGQYQWKVCPQGWAGSPAIFQRAVYEVLGDMMWKNVMPYIDDVIIYSKSFKEHLKHLDELFRRIHGAGFFLKLRKCEFMMQEMEYLGHTLSMNGVAPSKEKVQAIMNMPAPKNAKDVKRFMGLGSYYRKFIKNFSKRTVSMRKLTRNNTKFEWTDECAKEFDDIKLCLTSDVVMAYPDWELPFTLYTDASKAGLGAILTQKFPEGERVIEFASRGVTETESNYGISELECLAVMWATEKFQVYLSGRRFELITDHRALTSLTKIKQNNPRLFRWSLKLADLNYSVTYRPGKKMEHVDALSRAIALVLAAFEDKLRSKINSEGIMEIDLESGDSRII